MSSGSPHSPGQFGILRAVKHPLLDLLRLFKPTEIMVSPEMQEIVKSVKIPIIERNHISMVSDQLSSQNTICASLQPIAQLFAFDPEILNSYVTKFNGSFDLIPLTAILCFLATGDVTQYKDNLEDLLSATLGLTPAISQELRRFCLKQVILKYLEREDHTITYDTARRCLTTCDEYFFDVLVKVFERTMDEHLHMYVIGLISGAIDENKSSLTDCNFSALLALMKPYFAKLDDRAIMFLVKMTQIKLDESVKAVLAVIPEDIVANMGSDLVFPRPEAVRSESDYANYECSLNFDMINTFPQGLTPLSSSRFDDVYDIDKYASKNHMEMAEWMESTMQMLSDECVDLLMEAFAKQLGENKCDNFTMVAVVLFNKIKKDSIANSILKSLIQTPVFTPTITFFDPVVEEHKIVLAARKTVVDYLITSHPSSVEILLNELARSPIIFSEMIGRIHTKLQSFDPRLLVPNIKDITRALTSLWELYLTEIRTDHNMGKIQTARSTMFLFLFSILENREVAHACFTSWGFVSAFLTRVLEPSLQGSILAAFSKFLVHFDGSISIKGCIDLLVGIFEVSRSIPDEDLDEKSLPMELIQVINQAIVINRPLAKIFSPLIDHITGFSDAKPYLPFLSQALQFIAHMSNACHGFKLSFSHIQHLSSAVRSIEGSDPSDEIVSILLGTMGDSKSIHPGLKTMFIIENPSVLILLFSIIRTKETMRNLIVYMDKLCKHSIYNCMQCHEGELDLLLIKMSSKMGTSFTFRGCVFDDLIDEDMMLKLVLPLLTSICSYTSSSVVATKLLQLISPNEDRQFPSYAADVLNLMNTVACNITKFYVPIVPFMFAKHSLFVADNIPKSSLEHGFTIQFWIKIDKAYSALCNCRHEVLTIWFDQSVAISVQLSGETIVARLMTNSDCRSAMISNSLPSCVWTLMTLSFRRPDKKDRTNLMFNVYVNADYVDNYNVWFPVESSNITVTIGTMFEQTGTRNSGFPGFLGTVNLYGAYMTPETVAHQFGTWRRNSEHGTNAICGYPFDLSHLVPMKESQKPKKIFSLIDAIAQRDVFKMFTPLFGYLDDMPNLLAERMIDLMSAVVSVQTFKGDENDIFGPISILLSTATSSKLTYSLYTRFFALLDNCTEAMAESLTKNILVNLGLWISSESSHLMRIISHWSTALCTSCPQTLMKIMDFSNLLSLIRIYLWYTPDEEDIIMGKSGDDRERDPALDINICRQYMDRFIYGVTSGRLTKEQSIVLLRHVSMCKDRMQQLSFLNLFKDIGCRDMDIIEYLFGFFEPNKEDLFMTALKALYSMTPDKSKYEYISSVICKMNIFTCVDQIFDMCIELLPTYPLLYPILIYMSISMGYQYMTRTGQALKRIKKADFKLIKSDPMWMLWPVILCSKLERKEMRDIVFFVCSIILEDTTMKSLKDVLRMVDILRLSSVDGLSEFESELVTVAVDLNLTSPSDVRKRLLKMCLKCLLIHLYDSNTTPALGNAYVESVFCVSEEPAEEGDGQNISLMEVANSPLLTSSSPMQIQRSSSRGTNEGVPVARMRSKHRDIVTSADSFANLRKKKPNSRNRGLRKASSAMVSSFIDECEDVDGIDGVDDLIVILKKPLKDVSYCCGVEIPIDKGYSKSLLKTVMQLIDMDPMDNAYVVLCDYLRKIQNGESIEQTPRLEEAMTKFYTSVSNKWLQKCKAERQRLFRYWVEARERSEACSRKLASYDDMEDICNECILLEAQRANQNKRQLSHLMRELAHSWSDVDMVYKKSFISTDTFAQMRIKYSSYSDWDLISTSDEGIECSVIKIDKEIPTRCVISKDKIVLVGYKTFEGSQIKHVFRRLRIQRETAIEIFLIDGRSYLIDFAPKPASKIMDMMRSMKMDNLQLFQNTSYSKFFKKNGATADWIDGKISNFDYLMQLNIFASRSHRDATLYPIFPWIVVEFDSGVLDLSNPATFRDLQYPTTAQTEEQRKNLVIKMDMKAPITSSNAMAFTAPSNPTIVAHWLLRIQPFTSLHLETESGKFGFSERLFQNMSQSYKQVLASNANWELTPEFYSTPEFMKNSNGLQISEKFGDVQPPPWAHTTYEFIYKHRKALESNYVSAHLNEWIDIIFGPKSRGPLAIEAYNVLNPLLFPGVWDNAEDFDSEFIESNLQKSGQMPPMLFESLHPKRCPVEPTVWTNAVINGNMDRTDLIASVITSADSKTLKYISLSSDGCITTCQIQNARTSRSSTVDGGVKLSDCVCCDSNSVTTALVCDSKLYVLKNNAIERIAPSIDNIELVAVDDTAIAFCTKNGNVWIYRKGISEPKRVCSVYFEKPLSIAISTSFDLLVVATLEGKLLFYSISSGMFRLSCDLGESITRVLITRGWGFVVAETAHHLMTFSVNAVKLQMIDHSGNIKSWCTWKDLKGFDYIAVADDKGSVCVGEAFYLDFGRPVCFCRGSIVAVQYVPTLGCLSAVTSDGRFAVVPYTTES